MNTPPTIAWGISPDRSSARAKRARHCAGDLPLGIESGEGLTMPLVRSSLRQGTSAEYRTAIADGVHGAMVETLALPSDDHFQIITEPPPGGLVYDPQYLGDQRTDRVVFVQITLSTGRKPPQKRKLYERMVEILAESPVGRPQDLLINLVEVSWEN